MQPDWTNRIRRSLADSQRTQNNSEEAGKIERRTKETHSQRALTSSFRSELNSADLTYRYYNRINYPTDGISHLKCPWQWVQISQRSLSDGLLHGKRRSAKHLIGRNGAQNWAHIFQNNGLGTQHTRRERCLKTVINEFRNSFVGDTPSHKGDSREMVLRRRLLLHFRVFLREIESEQPKQTAKSRLFGPILTIKARSFLIGLAWIFGALLLPFTLLSNIDSSSSGAARPPLSTSSSNFLAVLERSFRTRGGGRQCASRKTNNVTTRAGYIGTLFVVCMGDIEIRANLLYIDRICQQCITIGLFACCIAKCLMHRDDEIICGRIDQLLCLRILSNARSSYFANGAIPRY